MSARNTRLVFVMLGVALLILAAWAAYISVRVGNIEKDMKIDPQVEVLDIQNGKPFVMVVTNVNHPVVKIMEMGFWDACQNYKLKCRFMGVDGNDIAGLVAQMDTLSADNASGISSSIYDTAFYAPIDKIIADGVPVINWHFAATPDQIKGLSAWVSADIVDYASRAGVAMGEAIKCKGTVAVTQGALTSTETPVAEAFTKALQEACPKVTVLAPQEEGYDPPTAIPKATAILTANKDIVGAFSTTGAGPTTWSKAAQDRGKEPGESVIISMDYSVENLDLVKAGWVYALVGQPLYEENYVAVELLLAKLKGEVIAFDNPLEAPIIKLADIDQYYELANRAAEFDALRLNK